jgi:hypothetical protein
MHPLVPVSARQKAMSSLQSTKLGHILQKQSPVAVFLSMIQLFRLFIALITTYRISG